VRVSHTHRAGVGAAMLALCAHAAAACPVIDATVTLPAVARISAGKPEAEQLAAYRRAIIDAWPGLYTQEVLGLTPGPVMERRILASLEAARASGDRGALKRRVRAQIAASTAAFSVFEDFTCDFPIYLADTLRQVDGAGRVVAGRRALVLGLDALEKELTQISLSVFFNHEFFHRYHFEAAGFSDDLADRQEIWRNLWAEGLATYASQALTPHATPAEALMRPRDLTERAAPRLPQLAAELLGGLDRIDADLFRTYFTFNPNADRHGTPPRAGYYVGYIVAQRLASQYSLPELAHLHGDALHGDIERVLQELAASGGSR
jgi:uncharacterized protein YjaZ